MNIDINELQKTLGEKELQILALKSAIAELQRQLAEATKEAETDGR